MDHACAPWALSHAPVAESIQSVFLSQPVCLDDACARPTAKDFITDNSYPCPLLMD